MDIKPAWLNKADSASAASAFFNQMRLRETEPQSEVGIAFPDDEWYRALVEKLEAFCKRNRVRIFWVKEDLSESGSE
jgi:hypothetical protein